MHDITPFFSFANGFREISYVRWSFLQTPPQPVIPPAFWGGQIEGIDHRMSPLPAKLLCYVANDRLQAPMSRIDLVSFQNYTGRALGSNSLDS